MKKTLLRNNIRKMHGNPLQSKAIHSQSPTHKKLLKKIELTQREVPNQYELSLQDNLVFQKPQEEVVDFRVEIERRFQKSLANHTYIFPRNKEEESEDRIDDSTSSHEASIDALRHVTVYELVSQNKKKAKPAKGIFKTQNGHKISGRDNHSYRMKDINDYRVRTEPDQEVDSDEEHNVEDPTTPIEIRIRDKTSKTYKNLLNMLEKQLNKPQSAVKSASKPPETQTNGNVHIKEIQLTSGGHPQIQIKDPKNFNKDKRPMTTLNVRNSNIVRDESQRSIGYYIGKGRIGDVDSKANEKSESGISFQETAEKSKKITKTPDTSQRLKAQGREKVSSIMESSQNGESMLSLDSRLSPSAKKSLQDTTKGSQDNKKKVYNMANANNILRALTPKYMANKNLSNWKDTATKLIKPQTQGENVITSQTPSSSLYQKAQDDVLNGKLRATAQKTRKLVTNENEVQRDDKDENIRISDPKGLSFTDIYASPKGHLNKSSSGIGNTMFNNFTKVKNLRKMDGNIGEKSSERQICYTSYDLSGKKSAGKPAFKLDLSNKVQKQRDLLSSTRTRENQSKEKSSEMLSIDSILKSSYDMQNHSLIRNTSKHAEISKRKLGVTPKGNLSKNNLLS